MSLDLSEFIATAELEGELLRVSVEVSPALEIAEITSRISNAENGGPAILFENVRGHSLPVVTNLLGSERRLSAALNADSLDDVERRIEDILHPQVEPGLLGSLNLLPQLAQLTNMPPKVVKTGRSQQVVRMGRDIDLRELPFPQCWPRERAATITAGVVITRNPDTGERHVGQFPLSVRGQDSLALHWTPAHPAYRHYEGYRAEKRQMPVAIALGGDPCFSLMASMPLPAEADAFTLAGFFRAANVELVKARAVDLLVPASADLIIEGLIDTEAEPEPGEAIALSTGYYSIAEHCPMMQVAAVTHRSNPVVSVRVPGSFPCEQTWIDRATTRLLRPIVRLLLPEVADIHCPPNAPNRSVVFVAIEKRFPHQARKVMNALWGLAGFATAKWIVVVDADIDLREESRVWFHVAANAHPQRDVQFCDGPADFHDHAAPVAGLGQKIGIDATRKGPLEGHPRDWPERLEMSAQMRETVERRWREYGL